MTLHAETIEDPWREMAAILWSVTIAIPVQPLVVKIEHLVLTTMNLEVAQHKDARVAEVRIALDISKMIGGKETIEMSTVGEAW
jgi:hypothetical protein